MDEATLEANVAGIGALLSALLPTGDAGLAAPLVLNNMAWFGGMTLLDFLRDVGKHARVGVMLSKDSVKARMGTPGAEGEAGEGMSYTEFTYQLLQACVQRGAQAVAYKLTRHTAHHRQLRLFLFVQGARRVGPGMAMRRWPSVRAWHRAADPAPRGRVRRSAAATNGATSRPGRTSSAACSSARAPLVRQLPPGLLGVYGRLDGHELTSAFALCAPQA